MKKQRWKESEKRREEERRSEKRQSQKKEDAGAQKGRKVAKPCVFHCFSMFFPRASERRVLLIVGACQTFSHLRIFKSSHLLILASSHLHILTSSHLLIFTSSHPHIFTSSHLHILSCPFPALLPSCSLALFFFLLFYFSLKARGSANETARNATLSHETRFDRQKLKWNCDFTTSAATLSPNLTLTWWHVPFLDVLTGFPWFSPWFSHGFPHGFTFLTFYPSPVQARITAVLQRLQTLGSTEASVKVKARATAMAQKLGSWRIFPYRKFAFTYYIYII